MKKHTLAIASLLVAGTLSACGGADTPTASPEPTTAAAEEAVETTEPETVEEDVEATEPEVTEEPTEEETTEPEETEEPDSEGEPEWGDAVISERGHLVKEVGQPAGIVDEMTGEPTVTFTLTDVVVDYECSADPMFVDPPANGHYVAFEWEIETGTAQAMTDTFYDASFTLSEWDLVVLDPDGKRLNDISGNALWCADSSDTLPTGIGPMQTAIGLIVLDLETPTGTLVLEGTWLPIDGAGGWEWAF